MHRNFSLLLLLASITHYTYMHTMHRNFSLLLPLCPGGDLLQLMRRYVHHAHVCMHVRAYTCVHMYMSLGATF